MTRDVTPAAGGAQPLLLSLLRPHRRAVALLLSLAVLQVTLSAAGPWLVGLAIDVGVPAARDGRTGPLVAAGLAIAGCAVASLVLNRVWRRRAGVIGQHVVFDLRHTLFGKLQQLSLAFHEQMSSGRVISRLTADIDTVNALFGVTLTGLLQAVLTLAVVTVAMLLLDVGLALVTLAALLPIAALLWWTVRRVAPVYRGQRAAVADLTVQLVESLNGIRAVQAFRRERRNEDQFGVRTEELRRVDSRILLLQGLFWPALELIFGLAALVVVVVGGFRVASGSLPVGVLAAFILYVSQFFSPVTGMAYFIDALQSAFAALDKIAEVLDSEPSVPEPRRPAALAAPVHGGLVLEAVSFGYGGPGTAGSFGLAGLDLRLEPGETVAMLGATGAGKSTIAKLLARFYDPDGGRILLDGTDLRELSDAQLRGAVTMLTQEGFLFAGSIAENIQLGRPSATEEEITEAARAMGADAFIRSLPDGYATDVHKRGVRLSAGQRQLIAFARAFLADPAVLILDEATSALDIPTERALQRALQSLLADRTALIIAHRLSTVGIADRVLVVSDGRVVDDGAPAELLARGSGEFAALYRDGHGLPMRRAGGRTEG